MDKAGPSLAHSSMMTAGQSITFSEWAEGSVATSDMGARAGGVGSPSGGAFPRASRSLTSLESRDPMSGTHGGLRLDSLESPVASPAKHREYVCSAVAGAALV